MDNKTTKEFGAIKFYRLLLYSVQRDALKVMEEHQKEIRDVLEDQFFGDGKVKTLNRSQRRSEGFRARMYNLMLEVNSTVDMLEDIPIYLKRFPFSKDQISKLNYLRHHIEFYLNQIYILQERIKIYLTFIERSYNKSETKHISETASKLRKNVCDCLDNLTSIRGSHVHIEQYDDSDLHRLTAIEVFVKYGEMPEMQEQFDILFKKTRRKWVKIVVESVTIVENILDACFGELATLLDSGNGQLLLPPNYR